jgi:hypothetical protein
VKRGGQAARERDTLRAALASIPDPCMDCPTRSATVEWSEERRRYVLVVDHVRTCPVRRNAWSERACSDRLKALLLLAGVPVAHYGDDVTTHR